MTDQFLTVNFIYGKYLRRKHRNRKDKCFLIRYKHSEQTFFHFENVYPSDVERTVGSEPAIQTLRQMGQGKGEINMFIHVG